MAARLPLLKLCNVIADVQQNRWIGSFQLFLMFGLSAVTGKLHDEGYTKHLLVAGSVIYVICIQMVSLANQYYSIFLAQGLGMGIGIGVSILRAQTAQRLTLIRF